MNIDEIFRLSGHFAEIARLQSDAFILNEVSIVRKILTSFLFSSMENFQRIKDAYQ